MVLIYLNKTSHNSQSFYLLVFVQQHLPNTYNSKGVYFTSGEVSVISGVDKCGCLVESSYSDLIAFREFLQ
jgi:hypothetical protein